jgi:hypothetical protein
MEATMHFFFRVLMWSTAVLFLSALPTSAQTADEVESREFQHIIAAQIEAFRADDGAAAYGYAAPRIKQLFPTVEIFMEMVRKGYPPVYRPRSFTFGQIADEGLGRPAQRVTIIDANGKAWLALYTFEKQPDGTWKIIGCVLVESAGGEA